jgi:Putative Flp pilus-assembly TadE/G-like
MTTCRRQEGQVTTLAAVFLLSILGMAALVVDAGAWFRAHRAAQATADAAALAAAQELPFDTTAARVLALQYAADNGGGLVASDVTFSQAAALNDTATVEVHRNAPTFFSKLFGISDFDVAARASARASGIESARWAAPVAVDEQHQYLSGAGCPCFDLPTVIDMQWTGPGAFRLINIDGSHGGVGPPILAEWFSQGLDAHMPLGWYYSDPGAKFNPASVEAAVTSRFGSELLFPVYRSVRAQGAGFEYRVVGWVGFHLTGAQMQGNQGRLSGWFTRMVWDAIGSQSGPPMFGVTTVSLVE